MVAGLEKLLKWRIFRNEGMSHEHLQRLHTNGILLGICRLSGWYEDVEDFITPGIETFGTLKFYDLVTTSRLRQEMGGLQFR